MYYADGTMVQSSTFANAPTFHSQWETLQKELGQVLAEANSSYPTHPTNGSHPFFGACRDAISSLNNLMRLVQTPPAKP